MRARGIARQGRHVRAEALLLSVAVASLLVACVGGPGTSTDGGASSPSPGQPTASEESTTVSPTSTPTPAPTAKPTPSATPNPSSNEPTLQMDLLVHDTNFTCVFLPNGNLDGSDQLGVAYFFSLLFASPEQLDRLVLVAGTSDTGWSITYSSGVNNSAVSIAQFSVRPADFGRSHRITIRVDADDHYAETDETNNTLTLTATLPASRPTALVENIPCS